MAIAANLPIRCTLALPAVFGQAVGYLVAIACCLTMAPLSSAQQPGDWRVMRVDIPVAEAPKLTNQAYQAMPVDELSTLLRAEAARRRQDLLSSALLAEATYVARLDKGLISSEQSRWVFSGGEPDRPFRVDQLSIGLERAINYGTERRQLLDHLSTTSSGAVQVMLTGVGEREVGETHWFGFSIKTQQATEPRYHFQLPRATASCMLISTSAVKELWSSDVVIERIASPTEHLPDDWPLELVPAQKTASQWWLVHLSGRAEFDLSVRDQQLVSVPGGYQHILRSARLDFAPREIELESSIANLDVSSRFEFVQVPNISSVHLRKSKHLRISSVLLDGRNTTWRILPSQDVAYDLLEIQGIGGASAVSVVEVSAACEHEQDTALPDIGVADSFAISGALRIFASREILVDTVRSEHVVVRSSNSAEAGDRPQSLLQATVAWIGDSPEVQVSFAARISRWTARSLTSFSVQSEWLNANCRMRLAANTIDTQEVQLAVGKGWFVDQVRLVNATDPDIRAEFFERGSQQEPITDVVISWQQDRDNISFELEVAAHRPLTTSSDRIRLFTQRILALPNADQIDNYVIEPSGRYQVEVGASLLLFQLQPNDLPFWQQQLISDPAQKWIFQGLRNLIPPIDLVAKRGSYNAQLTSLAASQPSSASATELPRAVRYRLRVEPISNPVESIALALPPELIESDLVWTTDSGFDSGPETLVCQPHPAGSLTLLNLPGPRNSAFTISCQIQLKPSQAGLHIPLIGLPEATASESLVILQQNCSRLDTTSTVELLPRSFLQKDSTLLQSFTLENPLDASALFAARVDGKKSHVLRVPMDTPRPSPGMVWHERIEHFVDGQTQRSHDLRWEVEPASQTNFEIELPAEWKLVQTTLNGVPLRINSSRRSSVVIPLPSRQPSRVEIHCVSRVSASSWPRMEHFAVPRINLDVRLSEHRVYIPPSVIAVQHLFRPEAAKDLLSRLNPQLWWKWSVPALGYEEQPNSPSQGWLAIELETSLERSPSGGLWIVDRSAVASLVLAVILAVTIWFYWMFKTFPLLTIGVYGFGILSLIVTPNDWVVVLQLLLLSGSLAALLNIFQVVFVVRRDERTRGARSLSVSRSSVVRAGCWLLAVGLATSAAAQDTASYRFQEQSNEGPASGGDLFGILTPVAPDGSLASDYAYVPSELADLLTEAPGRPGGSRGASVLSASYTLRTSPTTSIDRSYAQFLAAEYEVLVERPLDELRLPIQRRQLPLSRAEVNGQIDYELVVQEENGLRFRPNLPGRYLLKLIFDPVCQLDASGRARLQAQIPSIPSASIRVIYDSATSVELLTMGRQLDFENMLTATLGPTNRIDCSWRTVNESPAFGRPVRAASRLWVSTTADQLVASALLEIENPEGLANSFRIIVDENWEPVGSEWGDVELVAGEASRIGSRRAYLVRFRGDFEIDSGAMARVRMLMIPRARGSLSNIPAPFLILEKTGPSVDRTLAWSAAADPRWKLDGLDIWPELPKTATVDWKGLDLAPESTVYRVPPGSDATSIRRLPVPTRALASEVTRVHVSVPESTIMYSVQGEQPLGVGGSLRLEIPANSRIEYVRANDAPARFEVLKRDARELLVVSQDSGADIYSIDLELSYPTWLNSTTRSRAQPLARVLMLDVDLESSVLRVLRSAGLNFELKSGGQLLELEPVVARPFDLLVNLDVVVGQTELGNRFRESAYLPLEFELSVRQDLDHSAAVLYVERSEDGWLGRLVAEWQTAQQPLDFVFTEIPANLRETIESGNLPRRFIPMGDPERLTMCLIPPQPAQGRTRVELKFPLASAVSQQTLIIPKLKLLSLQQRQAESPVVALPRQVQEQMLNWDLRGREVADRWQDPLCPEQQGAFTYIRPLLEEMQISWTLNKPVNELSEIVYTQVALQSFSSSHVIGHVDYWIQPRGQAEFKLQLPANATAVGAIVGDSLGSTLTLDDGLTSVLLQPNYMPLRVRLHLRWEVDGNLQLALPTLINAVGGDASYALQFRDNNTWQIVTNGRRAQSTTASVAETWGKTLATAITAASGLNLPERESWLAGWHPSLVGLSRNVQVSNIARLTSPSFASNQPPTVDIDEFWNSICQRLQIDPARVDEKVSQRFEFQRPNSREPALQGFDGDSLELVRVDESTSLLSRLSVAAMILLLFAVSVRFARPARAAYVQLLSAYPWTYWLLLAILSWILLPTLWPSIVLASIALALAVGQYSDYRRTSHLR